MGDDTIKSAPPSGHDGGSNNDSGQDGNDNASGKGVFGSIDRIGLLELLGGVVFFAVGSGFSEIEFHKCAVLSYYLAVQSGLAAGYQYLRKTYRNAVTLLMTCSVVALSICCFECWKVRQKDLSDEHPQPAAVTDPPKPQSGTFVLAPDRGIKTAPEPKSETNPSPKALLDEIQSARPMQQDEIAKSFIGAKVRWLLNFGMVHSSGGETSVLFHDGAGSTIICRDVSDDGKNLLRLADKDAPFYVSGKIGECNPYTFYLTNCTLESYSPKTPMK